MDDLRKIAQELATIEQRRRLALDSCRIGIWDWDIRKNTLAWDEGMLAIYGISREEFEGDYNAWKSRVHPEDFDKVELDLHKSLEDPSHQYFFRFRVVSDGEWRFVVGCGGAIRNWHGDPVRMVGVNMLEPKNFVSCPLAHQKGCQLNELATRGSSP